MLVGQVKFKNHETPGKNHMCQIWGIQRN